MTPKEYGARLARSLPSLAKEERDETVRFYQEFLEDATEPDAASLGSPEELAARIMAEKNTGAASAPDKSRPHWAWRITLLCCTCYLWIPLWAVWYVLLATMILCIASVWIGIAGSLCMGLVCGIWAAVKGNVPLALLDVGIGLVCGGLAVLLWKPFWTALRWSVRFVGTSSQWIGKTLFGQFGKKKSEACVDEKE